MQQDQAHRYWISAAILLTILTRIPDPAVLAQKKSVLCQQANAVDTISQQIELSKSINNPNQRIAVLIRAADLLWSFQEIKARETFTNAFELALQSEREASRDKKISLLMFAPDERYVVVRAVAKRDAAFAKKLANRILTDQIEAKSAASDERSDILKAQRLLELAIQLLPTNRQLSLDLANKSLTFPASHMITRFALALANLDQAAADQFYERALDVYSDRPLREFLYLKVYPFALPFDGDMPVNGYYQISADFKPDPRLKEKFVSRLLRRAQRALEIPLDEGDNFNWTPGTGHILQTLNTLEPYVIKDLPSLLPELVQARDKLLVALPLEQQKEFEPKPTSDAKSSTDFKSQMSLAEKIPDPKKRFDEIVTAILTSSESDDLNDVIRAVDQVDELEFRQTLSDWVYFERAAVAISKRGVDDAQKFAAKVEGRLERSHLLIEIARELSKEPETKATSLEILDKALSEVQRLEPSVPTARALLTISTLLLQTNRSRAFTTLSDAQRQINRIDNPDFSIGDQSIEKQFRRRSNPGHFPIRFYMPGVGPETALREMALIDYDNALTQTGVFTDSFMRSSTSLAVVDVCLQKLQQPKKAK